MFFGRRTFDVGDGDQLMDDIVAVATYFEHGLDKQLVQKAITPMRTLIANVVDATTSQLLAAYERAPMRSSATPFTKMTILTVLLARQEHCKELKVFFKERSH